MQNFFFGNLMIQTIKSFTVLETSTIHINITFMQKRKQFPTGFFVMMCITIYLAGEIIFLHYIYCWKTSVRYIIKKYSKHKHIIKHKTYNFKFHILNLTFNYQYNTNPQSLFQRQLSPLNTHVT